MRSARLLLPVLAAAGAGFAAGRRRTTAPAPALALPPAGERVRLAATVDAALARAARDDAMLAVLMVDIDRFADVNHSHGHHHGDELLAQIEPRLRDAAGHDVVVRLAGDEFAVVREAVEGPWEALAAAQRLAAVWQQPFRIDGDEVFLTASTGIAAGRPGRTTADALLREAAAALSRAKERGRGHAELYDEEMRERAHQRLRLESDLRRAVEQRAIGVAYQPIVDLGTGRPVGVEALARWTHAERGPVSPSTFIAVAERSGVIGELGRHVLRTACEQAARWRAGVPGAEDLTVAVNVSAKQIAQGELYGEVREALRDTGLPPAALTIEVTESALMEESDAPGAVLATLRALGTRVVLDDFGTGHSSLSYLRRFPIDGIKLDRSFVDGFDLPGAAAVVEAIIRLGASLGLSLTAEGVETREQAERLRALQCRLGQGYLLARPLATEDATALLTRRLADVTPGRAGDTVR
ncbi:MAG: GGDEF domain-containing phosphodiesterase [Solirubrobacteraceae bacterium]